MSYPWPTKQLIRGLHARCQRRHVPHFQRLPSLCRKQRNHSRQHHQSPRKHCPSALLAASSRQGPSLHSQGTKNSSHEQLGGQACGNRGGAFTKLPAHIEAGQPSICRLTMAPGRACMASISAIDARARWRCELWSRCQIAGSMRLTLGSRSQGSMGRTLGLEGRPPGCSGGRRD